MISIEDKSPKYDKERLKKSAGEAMRSNVSYLQQAREKPIYQPLKGLQDFELRRFIYKENQFTLFILIEINL